MRHKLLSILFLIINFTVNYSLLNAMEHEDASLSPQQANISEHLEGLLNLYKEKYIEDNSAYLCISSLTTNTATTRSEAERNYLIFNKKDEHKSILEDKISSGRLWIMIDSTKSLIVGFVELYLVPNEEKEDLLKRIEDPFSNYEYEDGFMQRKPTEEDYPFMEEEEEEEEEEEIPCNRPPSLFIVGRQPSPIATRRLESLQTSSLALSIATKGSHIINPYQTHICIGEKFVTTYYRSYSNRTIRSTGIMNGIINEALMQCSRSISDDLCQRKSSVPLPGTTPEGSSSFSGTAANSLELVLLCYDLNMDWVQAISNQIGFFIQSFYLSHRITTPSPYPPISIFSINAAWTTYRAVLAY